MMDVFILMTLDTAIIYASEIFHIVSLTLRLKRYSKLLNIMSYMSNIILNFKIKNNDRRI